LPGSWMAVDRRHRLKGCRQDPIQPVGVENDVTSHDLLVLAHESTESIPAPDTSDICS
jgi:hypothetical protein